MLSSGRLSGQSRADQARALSLAASGAGSLMRDAQGRVLVDVHFRSGAAQRVDALRAAGARVEFVSTKYQRVTAYVAPSALRSVGAVDGVQAVMEDLQPETASTCPQGVKVSEGDTQLKADLARTNNAITGSGVTVGVLSDSYNQFTLGDGANTTAPQDVTSGD